MMTRKQAQLLTYIETYLAVERVSPSFEEMKVAVGLKSKSGVHRLIAALEERGFIRRIPNRARALEVVHAETVLSAYAVEHLQAEIDRRSATLSIAA